MLAQEVIRSKREAGTLSVEEIQFFINGMIDGSISESQVSALAMAVFFQGMNSAECIALTQSLQGSGTTLDWSSMGLSGPVVDKHSTGGVGDKVSMMLAPMLAACGVFVPMISGRGLGHTGGTLDKMDSIPGYNTTPDIPTFQRVVKQVGCAVVGQTPELAPADKRLYGIRDVTGTVESIPLITASILSKKLSAGLDGLVMDVKTGSGAFADNYKMAKELALNIVNVGKGLGLPITALITDMSQNLGTTAGNALEIRESIDYLTGDFRDPRLHEVTIELCAALLVLVKQADNLDQARESLNTHLQSGLAAEYFEKMVAALGGPKDLIVNMNSYLPEANVIVPVYAENPAEQLITRIDGRGLGNAVVELGGGRRKADDLIDFSVGLSQVKGIGESVDKSEPLAMIHAKTKDDAERAARRIKQAFSFGKENASNTNPSSAILERLE